MPKNIINKPNKRWVANVSPITSIAVAYHAAWKKKVLKTDVYVKENKFERTRKAYIVALTKLNKYVVHQGDKPSRIHLALCAARNPENISMHAIKTILKLFGKLNPSV